MRRPGEKRNGFLIGKLAVTIGLSLPAGAWGTICQNIGRVDAKNFELKIPAGEDGLRGKIEFSKGKGRLFWENPIEPSIPSVSTDPHQSQLPDVEFKTLGSFLYKAGHGKRFRVLRLEHKKAKDSSSGRSTLILGCRAGELVQIFYSGGEAKLKKRKLHLQGFEYREGARPRANPDWQWELVWDAKKERFEQLPWKTKK